MSEKNMFIVIIILAFLPILLICSNMELYILLGAIIIFLYGVGSTARILNDFNRKKSIEAEVIKNQLDKEEKEISKAINLDIKKLSNNIKIAKNIMIITYIVCSMYFFDLKLIKLVGIIISAYYVYDIICMYDKIINNTTKKELKLFKKNIINIYNLVHNILVIFFVFIIVFSRFIN